MSGSIRSTSVGPSSPLSPLTAPRSPLFLTTTQGPLQPLSPVSPALSKEVSLEVEREADQLFHSHTIDQIKGLVTSKRLEIDRRKEDLRQMVGERYRDLIDAADSIMHMKKCSEQAQTSVVNMEQLCQRLQQTHFLRGSGGLRGPAMITDDQALAAQVKLLAEAPENIWVHLETGHYLLAALTFLLARHIFSQLSVRLGTDQSFTTVQQLWHSVANFKDTIVQSSRGHISSVGLSEKAMLQSLCAVVLLEGCSPRQALLQTLLARKSSVQSVFSSPGEYVSVKWQVCQLVKTIVNSLTIISNVFCTQQSQGKHTNSSLLVQRLTQLTIKESIKEVIPCGLVSRLPEAILGYTPNISSTSLTDVPTEDIHSCVKEWITTCASDVARGMESILQHITSFKALSNIREAVHTLLSQKTATLEGEPPQDDLALAEAREEWSKICQSILGDKLCVWDTFLRSLVLQRAKALVDKHLAKAGAHATKLLDNLLESEGGSNSGDLWLEDVVNGGMGNFTTLTLKAKACNPNVYNFCQSFDEGLKDLLTDIAHFIGEQEDKSEVMDTYWKYHAIKKVAGYPFSLYEDSDILKSHVQLALRECIGRFLKNLNYKVTNTQKLLQEQKQDYTLVNRLILMGKVCQCLMKCCPNFSFLANGCKQVNLRLITKSQKKSKVEDDSQTSTRDLLYDKAHSIFQIWSTWCSTEIVTQLQEQFSAEMELNSLASALVWDEIQISEESESGKKVSSVIRVPSQCSVYVSTLLFALCQEITRVGGHALDRSLLEELSGNVLLGVLECYENVLQAHQKIPQPCALQLFYNFNFFSNILVHPSAREEGDKIDSRLKKVVQSLHSFVDPFDLDVFMPYILANLERQLTRSSVLYGMLLAVKGSSISSFHYKKPTHQSGSQEQHIVISLASPISRLPTLPMTGSPKAIAHTFQDVPLDSITSDSLFQTMTFFHHL